VDKQPQQERSGEKASLIKRDLTRNPRRKSIMTFQEIDIKNVDYMIPNGSELAVIERKDLMKDDLDQALILYGWDEVGVFDHEFDLPTYGFIS